MAANNLSKKEAAGKALLALNGRLKGEASRYRELFTGQERLIIGADGGALLLEEIGFKPDIIIGDFDSLGPEKVLYFQEKGAVSRQYPVEKDETDGELALEYCAEKGIKEVQIIGATGGRFDQQLANVFLLEYALRKGITAHMREPGLEMGLITERKVFRARQGSRLSLLPLSGEVKGVSIEGCRYQLSNQDLYRFISRGLSNRITADRALITLEEGLLLYLLFTHRRTD